jgi:hypothetical protein
MKIRLATLLLLSAIGTLLDAQSVFNAWPSNGVRVKVTTGREAGVSGVAPVGNSVYRLFYDRQNRLAFGYEIETERVSPGDTFHVALRPLTAECLRKYPNLRLAPGYDAQHLPTFDSARDLPLIAAGDQTSVDLPVNPVTGAKVTDTIEVSLERPTEATADELAQSGQPYFDLRNLRVFLNGQLISPESNPFGVAGQCVLVYLPGRGAFVLANELQPGYSEQRLGYVNGKKLTVTFDADNYEFVTDTPILPRAGNAEVWVIHEAGYRPTEWMKLGRSQPAKDEFFTASSNTVPRLVPPKSPQPALQ